ncbi:MAG: VWA domain-containing protein [Clostridia bacterium]|nr:VWA domain-containing protein [Clostridia bacterium]
MKKNIGNVTGAGTSANVTKNVSRRVLAALLALVFALSCVAGLNYFFKARGADIIWGDEKEVESVGGLNLRKGIQDNGDGTYNLIMEAYATGKVAQKDLPDNSPVDVVMLMEQTSSMNTKDVVVDYPGTEKGYTVNDIENKELYYDNEGKYRIKVDHDSDNLYVPVTRTASGTTISSWTAQSAYDWENTNKRELYYKNDSSYDKVKFAKDTKYITTTTSIDVGNSNITHGNYSNREEALNYTFSSGWGANAENVYVYAPREDGKKCWHQVYYRVKAEGVLTGRGGYFYTFYYYTNALTGSGASFTSGKAGDTFGDGASQVTLLSGYEEVACDGYLGVYYERNGYKKIWTNSTSYNNGTDGKLYRANGTSSDYNLLYTGNSATNPTRVLACPEPDTLRSHDYKGYLYIQGYRLYYEKEDGTRVYLDESNPSPVLYKTDTAYTGTLYEPNKETRLQASQDAAAVLQPRVNDPSSISTVTFNNDLNAGLTAAKNVLDTKGSGNKKIIVVFTDADKAEAETAKATSNTLEESGVSIYTVGISVTDDAAQVLEKLSTEYYGSSDVKKLNSDHNTYAYTSNEVPDLNKAVSEIAESIKHPTIQATLNENWVLQDIISDNFDLITKKVHVDFATVNGGVQGGTIKWDNEPQKIDPEKNDSVTYDEALLKEDKILRVTGFDFGAHRIEEGQPNGQKLVVTIYGLRRADFVTQEDGKVYSNEANPVFTRAKRTPITMPLPSQSSRSPSLNSNRNGTPSPTTLP